MAADRSVVVRLMANVSGYTAGMASAAAATQNLQGHVGHLQGSAAQGAAGLGQMGQHGHQAAGLLGGLSGVVTTTHGSMQHLHSSAALGATSVGQLGSHSQQAAGGLSVLGQHGQQASGSMHGLASSLASFGGFASVAQVGTLGLAAGIGYAAKQFMDFDHEMASVRANMHVTGAEAQKLSDYVRDAGTKFGFSANESAQATDDLAKAGLNTSQVMGGALTAALALAAAGNVSTGESAEVLANTISAYGIKVNSAADASKAYSHAADLIAAGADKSTASVHSLSYGLSMSGGVAHQMGISMEQTVGVLAMFDQHALRGSDGGTSFKSMLQRLTPQSKEAAAAMEDVGLHAYDAQGKFVGLATVADQLKTGMKGMTEQQRNAAMQTIFGADAVRAAGILFAEGGEGVRKWTSEVDDAGFAAHNAAAKTDSLKGDLNKLHASVTSTMIKIGQAASGPLRLMAQGLTATVGAAGPLISVFGSLATSAAHVVGTLAGGLSSALKGLGIAFGFVSEHVGDLASKISGVGHSAPSLGPLSTAAHSVGSAFGAIQSPLTGALGSLVAFRLASSLLGPRISAMTANMQSFQAAQLQANLASANLAAGMNHSVTGVGALVQTANHGAIQMGRFGTSIAQLGAHVPTIARMQSAFVNAAAGADRFPRAAGVMSASMAGLRSAGAGLVGALGGPWGIAIAAAGAGLSLWAHHQQEAAQKVAAHKQSVESLTNAIRQDGGAAGEATRRTIADSLAKDKAYDSAKKLGLSIQTMTLAAEGYAPAQQEVNQTLQSSAAAWETVEHGVGDNVYYTREMTKEAKSVKGAIDGQTGATKEARHAIEQQNAAMASSREKYDASRSGADSSKSAIARLAEAEKEAGKQAATFDEALNKVNNTFLALSGSEVGVHAAIDSASEALKKNGRTLDVNTKAGQENVTQLNSVAEAMQKNLAAMTNNGQGAQEVAAKADQFRKRLRELGAQAGKSGQELDDFVAQALKLPDNVSTTITVEGKAALAALDQIEWKRKSISGQTLTIDTKGLPPNLVNDLKKVEGARQHANGTITIGADTRNVDFMRAALKDVETKAVLADGTIVNIPASTNAAQIKQVIESLHGAAVSFNGTQMVVKTSAPMAEADKKKLRDLAGTAVGFNGTTMTINSKALTADALAKIKEVLAAAHDKVQTITTYHVDAGGTRVADAHRGAMTGLRGGATGGAISDLKSVPGFAKGGYLGQINGKPYGWQDGRLGGEVVGPGTGTSDQVLTMTSRGVVRTADDEHIIAANEVAGFGGHSGIYRLRQMARVGQLPRFASGGPTSGDDWAPDMSAIMSNANALKVDGQTLTDQRNRVKDQASASALAKATRDLRAARAALSRAHGPARLKAENAVATAIERQAKASRDLTASKQKLNQMDAGSRLDMTGRFLQATGSTNAETKKFLDSVETISKKGFGPLALSLLNQGDSDAHAIAWTLAHGKLSQLQSAAKGLGASDALADRKKALEDRLTGTTSAGLTATAQQQANAQLLALRASNAMIRTSWGPQQITATQVRQIVTETVRSMPAPVVHTSVRPPDVYLGSEVVSRQVTGQQQSAANRGSSMIGVVPR